MVIKKKLAGMLSIEIICLFVFGFFLFYLQTEVSVSAQKKGLELIAGQMQELVEEARRKTLEATNDFDVVHSAKAKSLAFMMTELGDGEVTSQTMREYAEQLEVRRAIVMDREGNVLCCSRRVPVDLTRRRFELLKRVAETDTDMAVVQVTAGGEELRLYAAPIDENRIAVVDVSADDLEDIIYETSSWQRMLSNITVGLNGYVCAISGRDYTFLYHPNQSLIGQDAMVRGIESAKLQDGNFAWFTIDGKSCYCLVKKLSDAYIVCAASKEDIISSRNITVMIVLFIFFVALTILIAYGMFVLSDQQNGRIPIEYRRLGGIWYNRTIGQKCRMIIAVSFAAVFVISWYMQSLFAISRESMANDSSLMEVKATLKKYEKEAAATRERYDRYYLNKCRLVSYILQKKPELANYEDLQRISEAVDVKYIYVFDQNGEMTATNSAHTSFVISDNPEDQSYEFRKLLQGVDYVIQEAMLNDIENVYTKYIGVSVKNAEHETEGIVQIAVEPELLEKVVKNFSVPEVLEALKIDNQGFAFAVDKESRTFTYYPNEEYIGNAVEEYGLTDRVLCDKLVGYVTLEQKRYLAHSLEYQGQYIYIAADGGNSLADGMGIALLSAAASLLCMLFVVCFLIYTPSVGIRIVTNETQKKNRQMVDVEMPDGTIKKTQAAFSRWSGEEIDWENKTSEQKVVYLLRMLMGFFGLLICVFMVLGEKVLGKNSVFMYILSGKWQKEISIFAVTASIMVVCVINALVWLVRTLLNMSAKVLDASGETMCKLIQSVIRYGAIIIELYYCLSLFGVDTQTLLASAGIFTLVIGLGARDLITDILAGILIIFEGDYRVGDIVTIGDWRGVVLEIGVRTTKVEDFGHNIKIIRNSSISGVVNMTQETSVAACDVTVSNVSIELVKNILEKNQERINGEYSMLMENLVFRGITFVRGNNITFRIETECREKDRIRVTRILIQETYSIFEREHVRIRRLTQAN